MNDMTTTPENSRMRYTIIESDMGPMISESRVSVFDVMDAYDAGDSVHEIGLTFNLSPLQVETALAYISQHRVRLGPQLAEIKQQLAEREAYYRRQAAQVDRYVATFPVTSQRAALKQAMENVHWRARSDA